MVQLLGRPVVDARTPVVISRVAAAAARLGRAPRLCAFLVGSDPASQLYVEMKRKRGASLGIDVDVRILPASVGARKLYETVLAANQDEGVDAILIQRPLPFVVPPSLGGGLQEWVSPAKDVDAFHPTLLGRLAQGSPAVMACTAAGIVALLDHYQIPLSGRLACVVGRSSLVGQPTALALVNRNATLVQCHSRTRDLASLTRQAEILVVASGVRGLVGAEHVAPGAVVIDVGIHRTDDGGLEGDVRARELVGVASALTPVPGGVGPLTVHFLFENLLTLVEAALDMPRA